MPLGISTTQSWPGIIGAVRGFGAAVNDGETGITAGEKNEKREESKTNVSTITDAFSQL